MNPTIEGDIICISMKEIKKLSKGVAIGSEQW